MGSLKPYSCVELLKEFTPAVRNACMRLQTLLHEAGSTAQAGSSMSISSSSSAAQPEADELLRLLHDGMPPAVRDFEEQLISWCASLERSSGKAPGLQGGVGKGDAAEAAVKPAVGLRRTGSTASMSSADSLSGMSCDSMDEDDPAGVLVSVPPAAATEHASGPAAAARQWLACEAPPELLLEAEAFDRAAAASSGSEMSWADAMGGVGKRARGGVVPSAACSTDSSSDDDAKLDHLFRNPQPAACSGLPGPSLPAGLWRRGSSSSSDSWTEMSSLLDTGGSGAGTEREGQPLAGLGSMDLDGLSVDSELDAGPASPHVDAAVAVTAFESVQTASHAAAQTLRHGSRAISGSSSASSSDGGSAAAVGQASSGGNDLAPMATASELAQQLASLNAEAASRPRFVPLQVPAALQRTVEACQLLLTRLCKRLPSPDAEVTTMLQRLRSYWQSICSTIQAANEAALLMAGGGAGVLSRPSFLFADGAVTAAAKLGYPLLLEDYDMPSQAVVERLNPLLETERSFTVAEDITSPSGHCSGLDGSSSGSRVLVIPPGLQVFATVHTGAGARLGSRVSPATLSRFTEVRVCPYVETELRILASQRFLQAASTTHSGHGTADMGSAVRAVVEVMFEVRAAAMGNRTWAHRGSDLRALLKWADLAGALFSTPAAPSASMAAGFGSSTTRTCGNIELAVLKAARFAYMPHLKLPELEQLLEAWWTGKKLAYGLPDAYRAVAQPPPSHDDTSSGTCPVQLLKGYTGRGSSFTVLRLGYTGLSVPLPAAGKHVSPPVTQEDLNSRLQLTPTPSLQLNLASVFAALLCGAPLLLEGPPGVGKTAIVEQVCADARVHVPCAFCDMAFRRPQRAQRCLHDCHSLLDSSLS